MPVTQLIPVDADTPSADRVNVFIHGYRSLATPAAVEQAVGRVRRAGVVGDSCLLVWMSGRWRDSAAVAGLRAAYRAARFRYLLSPSSLAIDAGVIGAHEVAQFKWMERRAERVGTELPALMEPIAAGRPVNLIGHSLGARVIHHALRATVDGSGPAWRDAVLLAGAADLDAEDWPDCVARLSGVLTNVYDRRDRVLRLTPDLRRRVGAREMPQVLVDGQPRVVNHHAEGVGHVAHWTRLAAGLRQAWPAGFAADARALGP